MDGVVSVDKWGPSGTVVATPTGRETVDCGEDGERGFSTLPAGKEAAESGG